MSHVIHKITKASEQTAHQTLLQQQSLEQLLLDQSSAAECIQEQMRTRISEVEIRTSQYVTEFHKSNQK